ncbi:MAG: ABC transporter permease [Verrucomicrobia bacterium]|jgi:peptide/nickel transport system permease protein/oligopeptide transport system permease protein|nr:ABC transporter permease [Verrucomicrobiota bacterium]
MSTNRLLSPSQLAWRRFKKNRLALYSACYLAALLVFILLYPFFSKVNPNDLSDLLNSPPSSEHLFGTDDHGRDLFARTLFGTRISLLVGAVGALVSLFIGVIWGAAAGYLGGKVDSVMMRFVDVLYCLPSIVFVIALITTLEGLAQDYFSSFKLFQGDSAYLIRLLFLFTGLGAISWLTMARIVRGQVLSLRQMPFVEASKVLGAGPLRILFRHIIPNVAGVAIVYLALTVPAIILNESFLSYLGIGVQPPQASLGSLIAGGAGQINPIRIYWWSILFPTSLLVTVLLSLNFLADGLRDALDPRDAK